MPPIINMPNNSAWEIEWHILSHRILLEVTNVYLLPPPPQVLDIIQDQFVHNNLVFNTDTKIGFKQK